MKRIVSMMVIFTLLLGGMTHVQARQVKPQKKLKKSRKEKRKKKKG